MDRLVHFGIPTFDEASTIVSVTERLDSVIQASFPRDRTVIVNADNPSTDGTQEAFLTAVTKSRKETLKTREVGKGRNFRALFRHAVDSGADVLLTLDADLEVIAEDWLTRLATPILRVKAEMAIPLYPRFWYDGNLTNQIVCPLVAAVTGVPIRQPIAGEFAFAPSALRFLLEEEWPSHAYGFGIDIHCVLKLLGSGRPITQVPLSTGKIHSWRSDTAGEVELEMDSKFEAITRSTLNGLRSFAPGAPPDDFPDSPPLGRTGEPYETTHLSETARNGLPRALASPQWHRLVSTEQHDMGEDGVLRISDDRWASILSRFYLVSRDEPENLTELVSVFRVLFCHRIAHVLPTLEDDAVQPMVNRLKDLVHYRIRDAKTGADSNCEQ